MSGEITREMVEKMMGQMRDRLAEPPIREPIIFCHPKELWWYELDFSFDWMRRVRCFRAFWQFRRMFSDNEIMVVLSSIIAGRYH
jgi:hypothetical protein